MSDDTKKCPFCSETIKVEAIFCRYCKHDLPIEFTPVASSIIPPASQELVEFQEQNTEPISEPILEPINNVENEISEIKSDGKRKSIFYSFSKEFKKNNNLFLKIALTIGLIGGVVSAFGCGILVTLYYFDSSSPIYRFWDTHYIDFGFPTGVPATSAPNIIEPTPVSFVRPNGDFTMSWDIYDSQYDSLGGILTIHRQGSKYTQTLVMSDKSCGTTDLTVISEGNEIKLTDRPGNSFGDYMVISSNGYLNFYDKQGIIYSVPQLNNEQSPITKCAKPQAEQNKEINVVMSVVSVESVGGNKVKITISTNLPNGMELMTDLKDSGSYWAQDSVTVSGGKLITTFGNVSTGNYRLTVTSPVVEIQPENVKAILGENSKNMTGDLITFDQSWNSYFLEYISDIDVK